MVEQESGVRSIEELEARIQQAASHSGHWDSDFLTPSSGFRSLFSVLLTPDP